jgi:23S rRNA (uracil1939-C5)-methyltransferase
MEFSFNNHIEKGFTLGLHRRRQYADIFDLEQCHLPSVRYSQIVAWLRQYVKENEIPVYDVRDHTGFMRFLVIRDAKKTDDLMMNIVTNYGELPSSEELVDEMTAVFPEITTIVHNENGQKSNIAVGEKETVLYGNGYITEKIMGHAFKISSNSFFQTNTLQAEKLYETAFQMLEPSGSEKVLDLYSGTGAISICLAPKVAEVTGVESVADAVSSAKENAGINSSDNCNFVLSDVKDFLRTDKTVYDVVISDPPRAGMHPKALKRMIGLLPEKILYISCNPSTFARDAKEIVSAGYELPEVQPVDMFPHTRHIELVAVFKKVEQVN